MAFLLPVNFLRVWRAWLRVACTILQLVIEWLQIESWTDCVPIIICQMQTRISKENQMSKALGTCRQVAKTWLTWLYFSMRFPTFGQTTSQPKQGTNLRAQPAHAATQFLRQLANTPLRAPQRLVMLDHEGPLLLLQILLAETGLEWSWCCRNRDLEKKTRGRERERENAKTIRR